MVRPGYGSQMVHSRFHPENIGERCVHHREKCYSLHFFRKAIVTKIFMESLKGKENGKLAIQHTDIII